MLRLNVGGTVFTTSKSTLIGTGENYFTALLNGKFAVTKDDHENIFIDRDARPFEAILGFLRTNKLVQPADVTLEQIEIEAQFFQIEGLMALLDERKAVSKKPVTLHRSGLYLFGLSASGEVLTDVCARFNEAYCASEITAPFALQFSDDPDRCVVSSGLAALNNIRVFNAVKKSPNIWGDIGAEEYGQIIVNSISRCKYWLTPEGEIKILVGVVPEASLCGIVREDSLVVCFARDSAGYGTQANKFHGFIELKHIDNA